MVVLAAKNRPPAITTGLAVFLIIFQALASYEGLRLTSDALFHFDINRLSFYPMVHTDWMSFLINYVAFLPIVGVFELRNGTVRTGVVLNVMAVVPGAIFCVLTTLSKVENCFESGLAIWSYTLVAFTACQLGLDGPVKWLPLPAWTYPVVCLALNAVAVRPPLFQLFGLILATLSGFAMGVGLFNKLIEPSTGPIAWIESKIAPGIDLLGYIVDFISEVDARELRAANARHSSSGPNSILPLSNINSSAPATPGTLTSA